jgi:uncharacterized protein (DUF736 family)
MAENYDNTDRGAAFKPFDTQKLILQGKLNDTGKDMKIVMIKDETRGGKNIIEVFEKIGVLFENDKKGNENAPDYTGPINEFRRLAAWRKSKDGQAYMTMSVSDAKQGNNDSSNAVTDDKIPF